MNLKKTITLDSREIVNLGPNTPNVLSPLVGIETPDSAVYYIEPDPGKGIMGLIMKAKLKDVGGVQIPQSSKILLAIQRPNVDYPEFRMAVEYAKFYNLDLKDMENQRYRESIEHSFGLHPDTGDRRFFRLPAHTRLDIYLDSPVAADVGQSNLEIEMIQRNR